MFRLRPSHERGHFDHGWLDSFHTFSFGDYHDPEHMGFRDLRVINEDVVQPSSGFPTHGHRDMEIVTYVLSGGLAHRDSTGSSSVLRHGDVQRMSAGRGIRHSEFNASSDEPVHLLQIWILPGVQGLEPAYEERHFEPADFAGRFKLIVSPDAAEGSLAIHQDVRIHAGRLAAGQRLAQPIAAGRHGWLQLASGSVEAHGHVLAAGDGLAVSQERELALVARAPSELLWFDLR